MMNALRHVGIDLVSEGFVTIGFIFFHPLPITARLEMRLSFTSSEYTEVSFSRGLFSEWCTIENAWHPVSTIL